MQQFARIRHGESIIPVLVAGNSVLDLRRIVPDITPETIASGALTQVDARGLATIQGDFSYLAPITGVRQVPATGFNYKRHIAELQVPTPTEPEVFLKSVLSLTGPFDPVRRGPTVSANILPWITRPPVSLLKPIRPVWSVIWTVQSSTRCN